MAGQVVSIDSVDFFVKYEGPKGRPLIILCHILMANHHMWDPVVAALHSAGFSTIRYDHVGHGKTKFATQQAAEKEYHLDDFCRHIHEIVSRVASGVKPFGIIGCSMGGVLALRYVQMFPGTLTKVMSCDAPGLTSLEAAKPLWKERMAMIRNEGIEALAKVTVERWCPDPCDQDVKDGLFEQTCACTYEGYRACANGIMNYDYEAHLSGMHSEDVMVLAGENDTAIGPREVLVTVADKIPGAKYVLMPDVGHVPPFHDSNAFNKIMVEFLQG
ncbi:hypothetical protein K4F52_005225 [Lecanicillium sp. MT-2017a]|nr:hypothetical protein K4F52_005225 [Lecanicillium sp. MT-2017a]